MYTSGTTGDPKGVMISNESILSVLDGVKRFLEGSNERVSSLASCSHSWIHDESEWVRNTAPLGLSYM